MRPPSTSPLLLRVLVVIALGVAAVVVVRSVGGGNDASGPGTSEPVATTLAELASAPVTVARDGFCDDVRESAVTDALGEPVPSAAAYDNGDTVELAPGVDDVAHEWGCSWTAESGAEARAWVFAPPVSRGRATRLGRLATRGDGCAAYASEPFGEPTTAFTCTDAAGVTAGRGGLFGDAWLSCTLTDPATGVDPATLQARADAWCVAAAVAAGS